MKLQRLLAIKMGFLIAIFSSANTSAQVCATPGLSGPNASLTGTLNSYYPGTGSNVGIGSTSIPVGAIDTTGGGVNTAIGTGDLLIVIQMQGAEINSSNSDCYGDNVGTAGCITRVTTTSSYAGGNTSNNYLAGNWEYCTAIGPVAAGAVAVRCAGGAGTLNAYAATAATATVGAYRYQVIRVPQYSSATLTGTVTAATWNGSTGGVASLQVAGVLTMGGNSIDASRRGFRGGGVTFVAPYGPPVIDPVNGTSFYRAVAGGIPGGEREGNFKGEGIAGTPRLVYNGTAQVDTGIDGYPGGSRGRGAPGNAGGGGNNQNGGGAGGGNGGLGGNGGGGWNDASRPTTFRDSGGHGGDGNTRGGNNLNLSIDRMIMGGGGGAGHVDGGGTACDNGAWGGNGGGIVIVKAGSFSGNGSLLADGNTGFRPNFPNCTDAAGGGGAGGSVYIANDSGSLASLTINARGGNGVNSSYAEHGPGGGGGGGVARYTTSGGAPSMTVTGGTNGLDANGIAQGGFPATPQAWFSTPGANSTIASPATPATKTTPPATTCFPSLTVTKATTTSSISVATGAVANYSITVTNANSGAAIGSSIVDNALPTNWTAGTVSAVTFTPALSATTLGGYVESAIAGQPAVANSPGAPANLLALATAPSSLTAPFFRNLTIPGNGSVTLNYSVTIPDAAGIGTYHNSAGVQFLDPTRSTATRVVAASTNNTANRCSSAGASTTGCSASGNTVAATALTAYEAGGAVAGSHYSGLVAGTTGEDVTLLPDLSITKTASAANFTVGAAGQSYTVIGRNNGRAIADQVFNTNQATDALATALVAPSLTIADTLPIGITVSSVTSSNAVVWTCTPNGGNTAFTCASSAAVYPLAAATNFITVTANVSVAATACPGPNNNTATITTPTLGDSNAVNNSGSVSTTTNCAADLTVAKNNSVVSLVSGASTVYTLTFTNTGPAAADGAIVRDTPSAGLTCAVTSCTPTGSALCPAFGLWPNLLTGGGLTIATLPATSSLSFGLTCSVTATGF